MIKISILGKRILSISNAITSVIQSLSCTTAQILAGLCSETLLTNFVFENIVQSNQDDKTITSVIQSLSFTTAETLTDLCSKILLTNFVFENIVQSKSRRFH